MAHFGTLGDFHFESSVDDIRGAWLYGRDDENLGKIKDVIFDHSTSALRYVVVDTGGWLHSKQFLIPADRVRPRGNKDDEFEVELSKKQIENFPPYDESSLNDEERWAEYERQYRGAAKFEETGGVLHQAGGTNILIPEGLPAEAPAAAPGKTTLSGYRSPIRHHEVGLMDTSPTAIGNKPDDERLTFVPDAIGVARGDIRNKELEPEFPSTNAKTSAGSLKASESGDIPQRSFGEAADVARSTRARDIMHREDDRFYHTDRGSRLAPVEQTIEGDAIFNSEDIAERLHQPGNLHDADEPSFETVSGSATEAAQGRLPNYPDASQGQRWARFEENLRRERPKIIGRCSVCEESRSRQRENAA